MKSGTLRHRITIQQKTTTRNDLGQDVATWTTLKTVSARVESPSGRELERARQSVAEASHVITIRWFSGLDTNMRVLFRNRTLHIGAINEGDNRDSELILVCSEVK
jgi:SPP1 family predicted phage head-tail adaptor